MGVVCTRELDGEAIEFGTTGYTMDSVFVLYDRKSESIWYPQTASTLDAVSGEEHGTALLILDEPAPQPLSEWLATNPDSLVLMPSKVDLARLNRAYLGVQLEDSEVGVVLTSVGEGSAADEAGFQAGDILLEVGDVLVLDRMELRKALADYQVGDSVMVLIERDGELEELEVTFEPH
ncbi:MAG: putative metalloprotease with PDZ domain [Planctomycetota bacterium]